MTPHTISMARILILEDNLDCITIYEDILSREHEVSVVNSLKELQQFLSTNKKEINLLMADLKLPDGVFLEWITTTRNELMNNLTTIIVSSLEDQEILSSCFEWGAVDYLIKPFRKNDLAVKINKALGQFNIKKGQFREEDVAAIMEELTSIESKIFQQLLKHPGQFVMREKIMGEVWKKVSVNTKTLDVHLSNIRKKLLQTSWQIEFEDAKGWKLNKSV